MCKFYIILTLLSYVILIMDSVNGYKILMLCPTPIKSHHNLCKGVTDVLIDREHEITFISAFPSTKSKCREIGLPELNGFKDKVNIGFGMANKSMLSTFKTLIDLQYDTMETIFSNPQILKILDDKSEKFDLVIYEYLFNNYFLGFSVKFNCPAIPLSPVGMAPWLAMLTGSPLSIATVPDVMAALPSNMNLKDRVINTIATSVQQLLGRFMFEPFQRSLYEQYFPVESKQVPYSELYKYISSVLVNSHPSFGIARPLMPNSVEIGGYHIAQPAPLPDDLKKIIDSSKHGVVLFSMGSNLKSSDLTEEMKDVFINTLGSLKETVLWKFEKDLPDKPSNVIIMPWLPQTSVLAHPSVKLFISHGGFLSLTEAVYCGVPQVIIPVYGDQNYNARSATDRGRALTLAFNNITETSFKWAIDEMLSNPKYRENAKKVQSLFFDRPITPRDLLAYQVEHVIRTKGAAHLSSQPLSMCSMLLLDVAVVILLPLGTIVFLIFITCRKYCCGKKNKNSQKTKTQ